jgi:alkylhydroperoxidase/carboxymuconolactone decarboxylase family protein YurZ
MESPSMLRRLMLCDEATARSALGIDVSNVEGPTLDARTHALVRLASLLAAGAAHPSYVSCINDALAAGASEDDVVGTLVAVAPTVGLARVVAGAPEIALVLGYEVDEVWASPPTDASPRLDDHPTGTIAGSEGNESDPSTGIEGRDALKVDVHRPGSVRAP